MQSQLLYRRNPMAYPSGVKPGIDPSHPAAQGLRFSGVATVKNIRSLISGKPGRLDTLAGQPTSGFNSYLGQTFNTTSGAAERTFFDVQSTANDAVCTIAAILNFNAVTSTAQFIFSTNDGTNGGYVMYMNDTTGTLAGSVQGTGGTSLESTLVLPAGNVPLFVVGSFNPVAGLYNWLFRRLDTGLIKTITTTGTATSNAPNGTYLVSDYPSQNGQIAAVMFAANFMSIPQLRAWAQDPWAFWYPNKTINLASAAAAAPPTGMNFTNLMLMGVG